MLSLGRSVALMLLAMLRTVTGWADMGAATVDRFVDRATRANGAIRAIGGTAPWYPCRWCVRCTKPYFS
jgi:hypothetical protein